MFKPNCLFAFALLSLCWCNLSIASEKVDIDRFEKTVIAPGLIQPMEMAIAPDGRIFLIELAGQLKVIDPATGSTQIVGKIEVTTAQENGLIGLALDPNFATNGWVYLQYSPPDFPGQRISRFDFKDDRLVIESEKCLFSYEEQRRECCHHAGSMEFGPDGNLYIGTGDNTNPFNDSEGFAPIDQRPGREPWDASRTSGNTKSYNGKILRIRPEPDGSYSIPDGNLFPKDGSVGYPEIYVMGCRNPWRLNIDQKTGFLYWGDVGPDAGSDGERGPRGYDEVNQAKTAGNYGWPFFIGANRAYKMVNFETKEIGAPLSPDQPRNDSVNNTGSKLLPPARPAMIFYPAGESKEFPEVGTGGRTACAGPVYYADSASESMTRFPDHYDRTLFAFEWSRNWILAVHLDEESNIKSLERFLPHMSFIRPIDLQFNASGSLYVIEYGETWGVNADAKLVRIDYVRGNRNPIAVAKAENAVGREPLTIQLSAEGSSDKDGDKLSYQWKAVRSIADAKTEIVLSTSERCEATLDVPGVYTVELLVTDSKGGSNTTSLPVIVGNSKPKVDFRYPLSGDFYEPGESIPYKLVINDVEDGTSDFELAEEKDLPILDVQALSKISVEAVPVAATENAQQVPPGLALMRKSDCFNCHAMNRPLVGPALIDIANKYRDQPHQLELSIKRVQQGSTGVWGKVAMLPHAQHTPEQIHQMVEYVFACKADAANPSARSLTGELEKIQAPRGVRLEAYYSDLGRGEVPSLTGTAAVVLRPRRIQAEAADEYRGTQPLDSGRAEGNRFMGAIENNGYLKFSGIVWDRIRSITVRTASAGAGGRIELHRAGVDGPCLATWNIEVNGDWEAFSDKSISFDPQTGQDDLYLVFKNEQHPGGLMNIDAVEFGIATGTP